MTLKEFFDGLLIKNRPQGVDEWLDVEGRAYSKGSADWWVHPLLVVQDDNTGCRVLDEDEEESFRELIDDEGNRPFDRTKPEEFSFPRITSVQEGGLQKTIRHDSGNMSLGRYTDSGFGGDVSLSSVGFCAFGIGGAGRGRGE